MNFDQIMDQYGQAIRRVASSYTSSEPLQEELEQEIAAAIYQAMPRFRAQASWRTYIYRIAHNCGMKLLRSRYARVEDTGHVSEPQDLCTPEHMLSQKQQRQQLERCIRSLPLKWRQPITMRLDGLTHEEISHVLGLNINTTSTRLRRAAQALKQLMKEQV